MRLKLMLLRPLEGHPEVLTENLPSSLVSHFRGEISSNTNPSLGPDIRPIGLFRAIVINVVRKGTLLETAELPRTLPICTENSNSYVINPDKIIAFKPKTHPPRTTTLKTT
jgi:hypothetical protein